MNGRKFRQRPVMVDVQRFNNGIFTKREWLEFCPGANIGAAGRSVEESLESRDFGWFALPVSMESVSEGDFVVREADGTFSLCDAGVFAGRFEPAYG